MNRSKGKVLEKFFKLTIRKIVDCKEISFLFYFVKSITIFNLTLEILKLSIYHALLSFNRRKKIKKNYMVTFFEQAIFRIFRAT